jgi:hypothetical protein
MAGRLRRHRVVQQIMGWYEGFRLLVAVNPTGVITGFGLAGASTKDQPLALRPSSPCAASRTPGRRAWDRRQRDHTSPIRASKAKRTTDGGLSATEHASSARPDETGAKGDSPSGCGVGWRAAARSWRRFTRSFTMPLTFAENEPTSFRVCGLAWQPGLRCTTSASSSTSNSVVPDWPSLSCSVGDLRTHTKRLRPCLSEQRGEAQIHGPGTKTLSEDRN